GFSRAPALYALPLHDGAYRYRRVNVAAQRRRSPKRSEGGADPGSLWHTLRRMIAVRRAHPAFGQGTISFVDTGDRAVLGMLRSGACETILTLHNLAGERRLLRADPARGAAAGARDLLGGGVASPRTGSPGEVALEPYQSLWLAVG
ncbi:MAG: hypothetical protein HY784_11245, partial [Chloroflexi bacterium]|nr:hypothetical protein [Chloroflexota bacterium]